ncbi:hypothetical protein [Halorarius halobius]|uniref:hypothetical protein n=1 Tax=Halorarius halobius TaxID=2962671 RepID=UPI0020CBC00B|nr:hypothetical protein [Halorarius halobius]
MVEVVTAVAAVLVAVALGSYLYGWSSADRDARVGDGLFLAGVVALLFADELLAGVAVDAALVVGAVLVVAGLGVKVVRPFTPEGG